MRIGVFGGSFDPPHVGHAMVASWLRWTDQVDRVLLVPVQDHPFGKSMSPYERRLEWCRSLTMDLPEGVVVSDIESRLKPPNYTLHMLDAVAKQYTDAAVRLVVGADVVKDASRWYRWGDIESRYTPIVVGRLGHGTGAGEAPDFPEISSTEVRRRWVEQDGVEGWVPARVLRHLDDADRERWAAQGEP